MGKGARHRRRGSRMERLRRRIFKAVTCCLPCVRPAQEDKDEVEDGISGKDCLKIGPRINSEENQKDGDNDDNISAKECMSVGSRRNSVEDGEKAECILAVAAELSAAAISCAVAFIRDDEDHVAPVERTSDVDSLASDRYDRGDAEVILKDEYGQKEMRSVKLEKDDDLFGRSFYVRLHAKNLASICLYQAKAEMGFFDEDDSLASSCSSSISDLTIGSESTLSDDAGNEQELGGFEFYLTLHTNNIVDSAIANAILYLEEYCY